MRPAAAAPSETAPASTRLELQLGGGWRHDTLALGQLNATATGGALSDLAARGAWFRPGSRLGIAAAVQASRFAVTAEVGAVVPDQVDLTGLDALAGLALRARAGQRVSFEGQLGYGWFQLPVASLAAGPAGNLRLSGGELRGHGPALRAGLRLALASPVALELGAEGIPRVLGARYQGTAVRPWRVGGHASASFDLLQAGAARWSALLSYQLAHSSAGGTGVDITQQRHLVAAGLRACWGQTRQPVRAAPAPPLVTAPVPPLPSAISGLVRAEDGQPVSARVTIPELGLEVQADPAGSFRFTVRPGQYTLNIEAVGFLPQSKQVSAGAGEQRIYNVDLQRDTR